MLNDAGAVGVRVVQNGVVRFVQIQIVSDGPDGMWIAGIPQHVDIITVGQEFVTRG